MTELFSELSVIGVKIDEEDRVVQLLASLPDTYNTLVTALEANTEVPSMEIVTERLFHEERKLQGRTGSGDGAMMVNHKPRRKGPKCHFCHKFGHIQRNCIERAQSLKKSSAFEKPKEKSTYKHRINTTRSSKPECNNSSDSDDTGLIVRHVLSVSDSPQSHQDWIVDSGATSHICNNRKLFSRLTTMEKSQEVTLGDGRALKAIGYGDVVLTLYRP